MAVDFVTTGSYIKVRFEDEVYKGVITDVVSRENDNVLCDIRYDASEDELPIPEKRKILLTNYDFVTQSDKHWEFVDHDFQLIVTKMVNMTDKLDKLDEQLKEALIEDDDLLETDEESEENDEESLQDDDDLLEKEELSLVEPPAKKSSPVPIILGVFLIWSALRLFYKPVNHHEHSEF